MVKVELLVNKIKLDNKGYFQPEYLNVDLELLIKSLNLLVGLYLDKEMEIQEFTINKKNYYDYDKITKEELSKSGYVININNEEIIIKENSFLYEVIGDIYNYMTSRICIYRILNIYNLNYCFNELLELLIYKIQNIYS